jgi:hypothetical protein
MALTGGGGGAGSEPGASAGSSNNPRMLLLGDGCRTLLAHPWAVRWAAAGGNDDGGDAERGALLEEAMSGCVTTQRGQRGVRGAGGGGGERMDWLVPT